MGISAEIGQHLLRPAERCLGVDHPVEAPELTKTPRERLWFSKVGEIGEEPQLAGREGVLQLPQEQPAEQPRQHTHRQEEARPASDPAGAVERGAAAGNDAMDVRMMAPTPTIP